MRRICITKSNAGHFNWWWTMNESGELAFRGRAIWIVWNNNAPNVAFNWEECHGAGESLSDLWW